MPSADERRSTNRNVIAVEVAVRRADLQRLTPLVALVGADNVTVRTDLSGLASRSAFKAASLPHLDAGALVTFRLDDAKRAHLLRRALAETAIGSHGAAPQSVRMSYVVIEAEVGVTGP